MSDSVVDSSGEVQSGEPWTQLGWFDLESVTDPSASTSDDTPADQRRAERVTLAAERKALKEAKAIAYQERLRVAAEKRRREQERREARLAEMKRGMDVPEDQIQEIFQFWVNTLRDGRKNVSLSRERANKIAKAIDSHGVDTCRHAILGCSESDFHLGNNPMHKRYDDIELILRDAKHIEDFARLHLEGE